MYKSVNNSTMIIDGDKIEPESAQDNLGKFILEHLRNAKPLDVCLENYSTGEQLTYKEFIEYAVSLSVALSELGVAKGDVVAVGSEKRIMFLPTTLAVVCTGAAYTPFDLQTGRSVLNHKINLARPKYFICSELFWKAYGDIIKDCGFTKTTISFGDTKAVDFSIKKLISKPAEVTSFKPASIRLEDIALILYSSGTTGMPKGVPKDHFSCILNSLPKKYQDTSIKTALLFGEWYHSYDIFHSYKVLCAGKKIVFADILTSDIFWKIVQDCQVCVAVIVPSLLNQLAKAEEIDQYRINSLKMIYSGSASLHPSLIAAIEKRFPGVRRLLQVYGMTEVGQIASGYFGTKGPKAGSVGMPCPGVSMKIVDQKTRKTLGSNQRGEICIRGPRVMKGYLRMDSSQYFDEEGFFLTGDLGYYDEDSYFYILDRMKDILFYDGYQVAPLELETILLSHPGVREAAVVGKPAGDFGEQPAAVVVRQPGAAVTEQELVDYVAPEVPPYMQLRGGVQFVPELPKNARGKILRKLLK